ncbi:Pre-mRNA-splicing factor cwf16 [Conoideocrella luteorostrata]|uniref:Splicing factor YJU2 n=1 Tax=Conoideocrella luteorostrata TaxID=1105319 RepID=A0AAJ0CR91_9HYPO|nr:Pre-mRNA-splicing factor cwf16 [Conoideocrella luteorostrata]
MSERKVLQKYYPADFDPRDIARRRGPKSEGPRIQTVRLMAPFSMKCMTCGEFIYKGRKFNSRKETNMEQKYLNIQIFQFHIKCTRCSAEIIFRTDPKNNDYAMVKGAVRNMEPWRNRVAEEESVDERLNRLEREEAEAAGEEEKNAMADLEAKNADAKREMAAADMLDEIRQRNARIHRSEKDGTDYADMVMRAEDEERARQEREDDEVAKRAFAWARSKLGLEIETGRSDVSSNSGLTESSVESDAAMSDASSMPPPPLPPTTSFKRVVKKKKDFSSFLGVKKKQPLV